MYKIRDRMRKTIRKKILLAILILPVLISAINLNIEEPIMVGVRHFELARVGTFVSRKNLQQNYSIKADSKDSMNSFSFSLL